MRVEYIGRPLINKLKGFRLHAGGISHFSQLPRGFHTLFPLQLPVIPVLHFVCERGGESRDIKNPIAFIGSYWSDLAGNLTATIDPFDLDRVRERISKLRLPSPAPASNESPFELSL